MGSVGALLWSCRIAAMRTCGAGDAGPWSPLPQRGKRRPQAPCLVM